MKMPSIMVIAVIFAISIIHYSVEAKDTYCRNRFTSKEEWIYCTKFGTATGARVRVRIRAKFLARNANSPSIDVGIYRD